MVSEEKLSFLENVCVPCLFPYLSPTLLYLSANVVVAGGIISLLGECGAFCVSLAVLALFLVVAAFDLLEFTSAT